MSLLGYFHTEPFCRRLVRQFDALSLFESEKMTQEKVYRGIAISPGFGKGMCFVYRDILSFESSPVGISGREVDEELLRIDSALGAVMHDIEETVDTLPKNGNTKSLEGILLAQHAILEDSTLRKDLKQEITAELLNAEEVVKTVFRRLEHRLRSMKYALFRDRGDDIADLAKRVLHELSGVRVQALRNLPHGSILVAERLLPSDTVYLSRRNVSAIVVEAGGPTCHVAILAREMGLPAVSHIKQVCEVFKTGDNLLVDGVAGIVTQHPESSTEESFEKQNHAFSLKWEAAKKNCQTVASTNSGKHIKVGANVGCLEDSIMAADNGADCIGLYRLEHVYLKRNNLPSGDELYGALKEAIAPFAHKSVTIRLLDVGADKELDFLDYPIEPNPVVGRRGIRFLFDRKDLLRTQIEVLLRLSKDFDIRILVPMVTIEADILSVKNEVKKAARELGIDKLPPLGAMVETPAAALCIKPISQHCDFLSIGTNDLTQYTMAAGRENLSVSEYYQEQHPAMLRLLRLIVEESETSDISVCGNMAARTDSLAELVELGLSSFSVPPPVVPIVKEEIRTL